MHARAQEYRKVVELSDNVLVAASGDQGDVEMFVDWLKVCLCMSTPLVFPTCILIFCVVCCREVGQQVVEISVGVTGVCSPQEEEGFAGATGLRGGFIMFKHPILLNKIQPSKKLA